MRVFLDVLFVACALLVLAYGRELDPAACAARFDVQKDKIIRTEESREMGARYLSELDVGSRHECRRLCCETDSCDVFVYEEKSPGSCYLFNCGPPEDFRCKFTAHGNFSSGVLALSRRLAELEDQEKLAPRPPAGAPSMPLAPLPHAYHPAPQITTTTTMSPPPPPIRPVATASNPPLPAATSTHTTQRPKSRCSRYQWECHTGGECIAVYNACDGIPQCADGSDEAPELGCPAAPTIAPARPEPRTTSAPPQPVYPVQMYDSEAAAEANTDTIAMAGGGERWPHRLLQAQPRRYSGAESGSGVGSHIFSHKGGLVQEEPQLSAFEPPQPQPQPWPRRPAWSSHLGAAVGLENSGWGGWGRDWPDERRAWPAAPQMAPQPQPREPELPYMPDKTMPELPEMPVLYDGQRSMHDAPKKGLGLIVPAPGPPAIQPAPPAPPNPADNATKKKSAAVVTETKESSNSISSAVQTPHTATAQPPGQARASGGAGVIVVAEAQRDQHDGLSEHPPAAIMLLVLGVLMTGAMGVLVGCRARASRRRLRRGGKPFAHDADYLVNGMYL